MTTAAPDRLEEWFAKLEKLEEPKRTQMMRWVKQEYARELSLSKHRNVAELAASLDPTFVKTPANTLIADAIEETIDTRRGRLLITVGPQEGKTTLGAVYGTVRALQKYPEWRVMLACFASGLAEDSSIAARAVIAKHGSDAVDPLTQMEGIDELGLALAYDKAAAAQWRIRGHRGGLVAVGLGGTISGRPADLLIIDDPIKGMEASNSPTIKKHVIEGFQGDLTTRLSAGAPIILIQCMTGDTPVLRPDGGETPLRDIRPGDEIATYERGGVGTSTVTNWASQGLDDVLCIRMMSGRTVRANARHPFLTAEGIWKRAGQITSGDQLAALSEAPGNLASHAPCADSSRRTAKACAPAATGRTDGPRGTDLLTTQGRSAGIAICDTGTESASTSTTACSPPKTAGARFVEGSPTSVECRSTGTASFASTTATTAKRCAGCCATTATSCSVVDRHLTAYARERTISTDTVVSVEPCGVAEVFDIQVERTENFIANGLVSHNTRWAVDDLAGWILEREAKLPPEKRRWRHINIPALSEEGLYDSLGREPGVWLESARGRTASDWQETKDIVGARVWASLYQGSPSPLEGGLVKKKWLDDHRLTLPPENPVLTVVGVDPCDSGHGDDAGIVAASIGADGKRAMLADKSAPMTSDEWAKASVKLAIEVGASTIVVEAFSARETYRRVMDDAVTAAAPPHPISVVMWPPIGSGRGGGDSLARSAALLQGLENGKVRLAGQFPAFEAAATSWQAGQHQPDSLTALTIADDELVHAMGLEWDIAAPFETRQEMDEDMSDWMQRNI